MKTYFLEKTSSSLLWSGGIRNIETRGFQLGGCTSQQDFNGSQKEVQTLHQNFKFVFMSASNLSCTLLTFWVHFKVCLSVKK